ncbi:MAG: translation initiation factor IF-2 [Lachnospiraceae bacterium]|nr:translation initiation factor IF-2 [Lachnospiraceae bacterium]
MAKMKVFELAKELELQSKEIVAFLQDKGYQVKAAQSSIEDECIELVRKQFGQNSKAAESDAEKSEKKNVAKPKKTAAKADTAKSEEVEAEAPEKVAKQAAAPAKPAVPAEEPRKKKKIIFVGNTQNSKMGGARPSQGGADRRPAGGGNFQKQPEHHTIIRPTHKPSQVTAEPYDVRQKQQQERRMERRQQEKLENREKENAQNQKNVQENKIRENLSNENIRTERTLHQANGGSQGNNRSDRSMQDNSRNYSNNDRPARRNGGQDNRFKKGGSNKDFMPESPVKDNEKHRDEEKRRISQEKDKRSRKDLIYEDDEMNLKNRNKPGRFIKPEKKVEAVVEEQIKVITLPETLTIRDLADKMKMQPSAIVKKLFMQGQIVTVNSEISFEDAENIAIEYEIICEKEVKVDVIEELLKEEEEDESKMVPRPPVICVMGHVDHGKTSLLDAIRKTNVTDKEAGGITQAIGAYTVTANNQKITFLDTPGHEAFTAMRMRGANSTDIAVLVVAADDGVMPQTIEAINHAKAAGIEIIVAVNKIDKPNANIDRVKQEMTEYELIPADWGGSTEFVPVSAKSGEGINNLLETILLTAEILELKANPNRRARGLVIEAELDKGRGPVATVLVQKGTLHVGDFISAGASHGKVRAMIDDKGRRVKEAIPSMPVEILGLSDVPSAGEVFIVHENDKSAKSYADTYMSQHKEEMLADTKSRMSLDDLFNQIQEGNLKELNLIVKADVQGSVEAVKQSLMKLSNDEIVVKCIHGGVGAITESDVTLASASSAIIIGFNVRPDATAKSIAEREGVDVRLYKVIYQAIEDIEAAMKGMLDPVYEEKIIGHAEVRQIFKASSIGNIAGSYVLDGEFQRGCKIRITREGEQIYEGALASLKRFKDDVKEVKAGFECGLVFEGFDQMQELDIIEAYIMVEVPRT